MLDESKLRFLLRYLGAKLLHQPSWIEIDMFEYSKFKKILILPKNISYLILLSSTNYLQITNEQHN